MSGDGHTHGLDVEPPAADAKPVVTPREQHTSREGLHLEKRISELLPILWKTDASPQLSKLLNIIAHAKTMGAEGYELLKGLADKLRSLRAFDDLYTLTSEMNADGLGSDKTRLYEVQALIELGVFDTALELVRPLMVGDFTSTLPREAYGNLGRIYKQMYVNAEASEKPVEREVKRLYLERAYTAYMHVWDKLKNDDATWHGVNALAVAKLAAVKGYRPLDPKLRGVAQAIVELTKASTDVWAQATLGEALLALEDYEGATQAYAAFADDPGVSPFHIGAALRQLQEIWQLDGDDATSGKPVRILKAGMLAKLTTHARFERLARGEAGRINALEVKLSPKEVQLLQAELRQGLPDDDPEKFADDMARLKDCDPGEMHKLCGINKPVSRRVVLRKLELSASVCRIETRVNDDWVGLGTGFAIEGRLLHEAWGEKPVIVTNNHVVSSGGCVRSRKPSTSRAVFATVDGAEREVYFGNVLWESEYDFHDVTVLELKDGLPAGAKALTVLSDDALGRRAGDEDGIGMCYVIGYPFAQELCFSLADNVLLDHNGPENCEIHYHDGKRICIGAPADPVRIHYRTPTTRGNSGSPVFDAQTIGLLGVHHAGDPNMKRLNPHVGNYAANEGIWIESIRRAIDVSETETPEESARVPAQRGFGSPAPRPLPPRGAASDSLMGTALKAALQTGPNYSGASEIKGFAGKPSPGVSRAARVLLYKPGPASEADILAARLETVIGTDTRTQIIETEMSPWRMICAIRVKRGGMINVGTGFFIGPRTILTAGHVVVSPTYPKAPGEITVIPGLNSEKEPYKSFKAERISVHPNWNGPYDPAFDVAAIHLAEDVGQEVGWFEVGTRDKGQMKDNWLHISGYPGDKKERAGSTAALKQASQLWHHAAPLDRVEFGRAFYRIDTFEGQSGAPIYVLENDLNYAVPTVVGIHAYGTRSTPGSRAPANSGVWIDAAMLSFISTCLAQ